MPKKEDKAQEFISPTKESDPIPEMPPIKRAPKKKAKKSPKRASKAEAVQALEECETREEWLEIVIANSIPSSAAGPCPK